MNTGQTNPQDNGWFLGVDNEAQGPFTLTQVKTMFADGRVNGQSPAWVDGMEDWAPANTLAPLRALIVPPKLGGRGGPPGLKTAAAASSTSNHHAASRNKGPSPEADETSPEALMARELGLTPARIDAMAALAVNLASQTKLRLGLSSPPPRLGFVQSTKPAV